jgi:hypothetical protein
MWLTRGLAADPGARFADAAAMKRAWRVAVAGAQRSAGRGTWWRRLMFGGPAANVPGRR